VNICPGYNGIRGRREKARDIKVPRPFFPFNFRRMCRDTDEYGKLGGMMMHSFITLSDNTEIFHSDMLEDGRVKVYIETSDFMGFRHATCYIPTYEWENVYKFSKKDIEKYQQIIQSFSEKIIKSSQKTGKRRR